MRYPQTVRELYLWLNGKLDTIEELKKSVDRLNRVNNSQNKVLVSLNAKSQSLQNELTEHKNSHWKMIPVYLGISTVVLFLFGLLFKYVIK